jgi:hypothetical protein
MTLVEPEGADEAIEDDTDKTSKLVGTIVEYNQADSSKLATGKGHQGRKHPHVCT